MRHKFVHEFEDDPPHGDFEVDLDVPPGAKIQFDLDAGNLGVRQSRRMASPGAGKAPA